MIKIIPDQTSFHHNQPHIPGINCYRHQPDSIPSTQNLCLVDKTKLHQPDNDLPNHTDSDKVTNKKSNMSGKKTFLNCMVEPDFVLTSSQLSY